MVKIEFSTDNSAFEDGNKEQEISRILKDIEKKVENGYENGIIMDINGNKIGWWHI